LLAQMLIKAPLSYLGAAVMYSNASIAVDSLPLSIVFNSVPKKPMSVTRPQSYISPVHYNDTCRMCWGSFWYSFDWSSFPEDMCGKNDFYIFVPSDLDLWLFDLKFAPL